MLNLNGGTVISSAKRAALAGTTGSPSSTNKFVTDQDTRLAANRTGSFQVIDPVASYNASGCATTTTGNITTGTAALVVASTSTFHVSQGILVKGAGAAGAHLVTTISAIAGTTITLAANAGTTVTGAVVQHDDTAAINAALQHAVDVGGGMVFLTKVGTEDGVGRYRCNGPWTTTGYRSILKIPRLAQGIFAVSLVRVELIGEVSGILFPLNNSMAELGVTIDSTDAGTSAPGGSGIAAVLGPYGSEWTGTDFFIDRLKIAVPSNPAYGAVNFQTVLRASVGDSFIASAVFPSGGDTTAVQPTNDAYGVTMPGNNNAARNVVGTCFIGGFKNGLYAGEHTRLDSPLIMYCYTGMRIQDSAHMIHGAVDIEQCCELIRAEGRAVLDINLTAETGTSATWHKLFGTTGVIGDYQTRGRIVYELGGPVYGRNMPTNGLINVQLINAANMVQNPANVNSPGRALAKYNFSDVNDASGNAVTLTNHGATFAAGKVGNCAVFDGASYMEDAASNFAALIDSELTVCGWIWVTSVAAYTCLASQFDQYPGYNWGLTLTAAGAVKAYANATSDIAGGAGTIFNAQATTTPGTGAWHFVALQISSLGKFIRVKVDNDAWVSTTMDAGLRGYNTPKLRFGADKDTGGGTIGNYFNGKLDAFQFHNRILTELEISALYNNGSGLE